MADEATSGAHEDAGAVPTDEALIEGDESVSKTISVPVGTTSEQELREHMVSH